MWLRHAVGPTTNPTPTKTDGPDHRTPAICAAAGAVTLLLESQEEAYLAAVLVPEGKEVPIGAPVAVLCEDEGDVSAASDAAQRLARAGLSNVYNEAAMQRQQQQEAARGFSLQLLEWQSYLKESSKEPDSSSSSSCGCM